MSQHFPALITLLTLFLLLGTAVAVGRARSRYGIKAPATTGNPDFERVFRVQMNTQEAALIFLPALWLFNFYHDPLWAGVLGSIWLVGRVIYAVSYIRAAEARTTGFIIGLGAFALLAGGAGYGILLKMFFA